MSDFPFDLGYRFFNLGVPLSYFFKLCLKGLPLGLQALVLAVQLSERAFLSV